MALKDGKQYMASLEALELKAHVLGEKQDRLSDHGLVAPSREAVAFTFDAAHDSETREMFCVESPPCNDVVNRFSHLHQSTDLMDKNQFVSQEKNACLKKF